MKIQNLYYHFNSNKSGYVSLFKYIKLVWLENMYETRYCRK